MRPLVHLSYSAKQSFNAVAALINQTIQGARNYCLFCIKITFDLVKSDIVFSIWKVLMVIRLIWIGMHNFCEK